MKIKEILKEIKQQKLDERTIDTLLDILKKYGFYEDENSEDNFERDETVFMICLVAGEVGYSGAVEFADDLLEVSSLRYDDDRFSQTMAYFKVSKILILGEYDIDKNIKAGIKILENLKNDYPFDVIKDEIINLRSLVNNEIEGKIETIFGTGFLLEKKVKKKNNIIEKCQIKLSNLEPKNDDKEKEAIKEIIKGFREYCPDDMILCMKYHKDMKELEKETIAYYAGLKYFYGFSQDMENFNCEIPKGIKHKKIPENIEILFKKWILDWLQGENPKVIKKVIRNIITKNLKVTKHNT